jgi:hypothetical protein
MMMRTRDSGGCIKKIVIARLPFLISISNCFSNLIFLKIEGVADNINTLFKGISFDNNAWRAKKNVLIRIFLLFASTVMAFIGGRVLLFYKKFCEKIWI